MADPLTLDAVYSTFEEAGAAGHRKVELPFVPEIPAPLAGRAALRAWAEVVAPGGILVAPAVEGAFRSWVPFTGRGAEASFVGDRKGCGRCAKGDGCRGANTGARMSGSESVSMVRSMVSPGQLLSCLSNAFVHNPQNESAPARGGAHVG